MENGYEICEVESYTILLKELTSKRAAITLSGFYLSAQYLQNVTYIYPAITTYTISTLTRMLFVNMDYEYSYYMDCTIYICTSTNTYKPT